MVLQFLNSPVVPFTNNLAERNVGMMSPVDGFVGKKPILPIRV